MSASACRRSGRCCGGRRARRTADRWASRLRAQDQVRLGVGDERRALEAGGDRRRIAGDGEDIGARVADAADLRADAEPLGERADRRRRRRRSGT